MRSALVEAIILSMCGANPHPHKRKRFREIIEEQIGSDAAHAFDEIIEEEIAKAEHNRER